jgi:hypothetical protein
MNNYSKIKVGDELFYSKGVGISYWGKTMYSRTFFISCKVTKVTKTQFTTISGRYRKVDGYCIGEGLNIYSMGDKSFWEKRKVTRCEKLDLANYENELNIVRDALYFDWSSDKILKVKRLEVAQRIASLLKQVKEIINEISIKD